MSDRKRVVFLTFYYEAWDALAEVYQLMKSDSRFEVKVVAIDRRLTGEAGFSGAYNVSDFFGGLGVPHLVNADLGSVFRGADGIATGPDYIFVNYPWQRNYAPQYRPDQLAKVGRIVYVPYYSLPMTQEPVDGVNPASGFVEHAPHLYSQRMHQLTSIDTRQFGSTKLDALVHEVEMLGARQAGKVKARKRVLWAPHHSYSPHWLNFGNFARVHEEMLAWAAAHGEFEVVLRAHPFMFGTLVDRGVMSRAALDDWLARWSALPNARVEVGESAAESFAAADYLVTDGISFLAEWPLAKGVPGIFMENPEHWPFTELGSLAAAANVVVREVSELDELLIGAGGADAMPDRSAQIAALREAAMPNAGQTAARIVEAVAADASGLIDPATVTEVPWELQPGREPLD